VQPHACDLPPQFLVRTTRARVPGLLVGVLGAAAPALAQSSAPTTAAPSVRSALTGLDLPGDAKIEEGIFRRAWRMSTLEQQAKNVGVATADSWELYRLQSGTVGGDATPVITSLRIAG
jgi:hypothetical protein